MNGGTKSRVSTISLEWLQCFRWDSTDPTDRRRRRRRVGRRRLRWEDDVTADLGKMI
jgi:hypothetical protein